MQLFVEGPALSGELDAQRRTGRSVGLVPTMGALHDGHLSLVRRARSECDVVVVTVFVNPLQFGPSEDFAAYPRDLDRDSGLAAGAGAGVVFAPSVEEMYPEPFLTTVCVREVTAPMEGASRPGHFDGVTTVVAKLFGIAGRCRAYFGEKDFQQLSVVRRMADDLSLPVEVVGCPIVREADGLAMSSRNVYLDAEQRSVAPVLHRSLLIGAAAVAGGERDPSRVRSAMVEVLNGEPLVRTDYAEVVDPGTLLTPPSLSGEVRLLVAARLGPTRLIDNVGVSAHDE